MIENDLIRRLELYKEGKIIKSFMDNVDYHYMSGRSGEYYLEDGDPGEKYEDYNKFISGNTDINLEEVFMGRNDCVYAVFKIKTPNIAEKGLEILKGKVGDYDINEYCIVPEGAITKNASDYAKEFAKKCEFNLYTARYVDSLEESVKYGSETPKPKGKGFLSI